MNILFSVSGNGVSVGEVVNGQIHCAAFAEENQSRPTLSALVRKYWGHPNTIVVEDVEFGTGYYAVTTHCGANGASWGYRLHQILSQSESIECHNAQVRQAQANEPVTAKSGLAVAFERVAMGNLPSKLKTITAYIQTKGFGDQAFWALVIRDERIGGFTDMRSVLRAAKERLGRVTLDVWDCDRGEFVSELVADPNY